MQKKTMSDRPRTADVKQIFGNARFDVEHALGMYAANSCTIFAEDIYDKDALAPLMSVRISGAIFFHRPARCT